MKTKIILLAGLTLILLTNQEINAQFKFGLHAGMNVETQAELGELWNNVDLSPGIMVGGFMEYPLGNKISLQTEFNYQTKGEKSKSIFEGSEMIIRRQFNYLSIPLLVKGNFGKELNLGEKWNITGFTGPYLGYLTSANSDIRIGGSSTETSIDKQAEKVDLGIIIGGGIVYKVNNKGAIVAELRYEMGLNKIDKEDPDLRNKGFGVTIGYRF